MTHTIGKKILALLLALTLCFSLLPVSAFAGEPEDEVTLEDSQDPPVPEDGDEGEDCDHVSAEAVREKAVAPTCTAAGSHDEVVYCELCGKELDRETVEDPALGHDWEAVEAADPTCTAPGHTAGVVCTRCGETLEGCEEIAPLGHTPVDVEEVPAEVGKPGTKAGQKCAVCGEVLEGCEVIDALPEPEDGPEDEPERVRVEFICEPKETQVTVYEAERNDKDALVPVLDENGEPVVLEPEEDGAWLLLPGEYLYDAACEGYESVEKAALTVKELAEDENAQTVELTLSASRKRGDIPLGSTIVDSGECGANGDNLIWTLDGAGLLTISGTGAMADYSSSSTSPWHMNRNISSLVIENGVTSIGNWAFYGCSGITSVTIPGSVTSIGSIAIDFCTSLTDVYYGGSRIEWLTACKNNSVLPSTATVSYGKTQGGGNCGVSGDNLTWTLTNDGLLTISGSGEMANYDYNDNSSPWYYGRHFLTSAEIESGVTSIGQYSFYYCRSLEDVTIPGSVTNIGTGAFNYCDSLESVTIPGSVTSIGQYAFYYCSSLTDVYYGGSRMEWVIACSNYYVLPATATVSYGKTQGGGNCGVNGDNLTWTMTNDGVLTISGSGEMANNSSPWYYGRSFLTSVEIESGVTSIGDYAFSSCSSLTSVSIPGSVTSIGRFAFSSCSRLTNVYYGGSRLEWLTACNNYSVLPETATVSYGKTQSSGNCGVNGDNLTWTLTNDGLLTISGSGEMANNSSSPWYYGRSFLASVEIESGVTSIGQYAFNGCSSLESITIPASVTSIGDYAFSGCSSLTSVTIPDSVTSVGRSAFSGCSSLTNVYYGGSRIEWLTACKNNSVLPATSTVSYGKTQGGGNCGVNGDNLTWTLTNDGLLTISGSGEMGNFNSNSSPWHNGRSFLTSAEIDSGVTSIGQYAFYYCSSLESVTIPDSITSIGGSAFSGCSSLTDVYYGGSRIEWLTACKNNSVLPATSTVSYGKTQGGGNCGVNGDNLTWTMTNDGVLTISGSGEMANFNYNLSPWYYGRSFLTSVEIDSGVTSIGRYAFRECSSLEDVTIPGSVTNIGTGAFNYCDSLESVTIPGSATSIGSYAFSDCSSLTSAGPIGSGCSIEFGWTRSIPANAFSGCSSLTSVTIPAEAVSIGSSAFSGCSALTAVEIPARVLTVGDSAFSGCGSLAAVTLPAGLKTIGYDAFYGCGMLAGIEIPSGVTSIGGYAFSGCTRLTHVSIPASAVSAGSSIFSGCSGLTSAGPYGSGCSIEFGWTRSIPGNPFSGSKNLVSIILPDGLTRISAYAFENCSCLQKISIPASVTNIGSNAFYGCDGLSDIYYGGSEAKWNRIQIDSAGNELLSAVTIHYNASALPQATGIDIWVYFNEDDGSGHMVRREAIATGQTFELDFSQIKTWTQCFVKIEPADALQQARWSSSDPMIATVDERGWISFHKPGVVTITASATDRANLSASVVFDLYYHTRVPAPGTAEFDREYLILNPGDADQLLSVTNLPDEWKPYIDWFSDNADVASVAGTGDGQGMITAVAAGTAWITASVDTGNGVIVASCRVDVVEGSADEELTGVRLVDTKATTELYKSTYTRITVVPELRQNKTAGAATILAPDAPADNNGVAIESARFANDGLNTLFALRVVDDRTLEIVPLEAAVMNAKAVKSSYKSALIVTVDEKEYPTGTLNLTVKKSLPKVAVKAVKFNSFLVRQEQALSFSGARVTSAVKTSGPAWLEYNEAARSVTYVGARDAKQKSAKLNLAVRAEGWNVELPVAVTVSAAKSAPKLTLKPATVSLHPGAGDFSAAAATVTPAAYADLVAWPLEVVSVLEGKKAAPDALDIFVSGRTVYVQEGPAAPTDGKAHTYKVTLALLREESPTSVKATLTVKLLASSTKISMSAKAAGSIDTALRNSSSTVTVTPKGVNAGIVVIDPSDVTILKEKSKTPSEDVTELFELSSAGALRFTVRQREGVALQSGYTYTAVIQTEVGGRTLSCRVKLPVKFSNPAKLKPSVTLKAKGTIDVIRPNSAVTVTPTVKNCYTYTPDAADLHIWRVQGKTMTEATEDFDVSVSGNAFRVTLKPGSTLNNTAYKYKVSLSATVETVSGTAALNSAKAAMSVKMGKAKLTQSTKSVRLLKTDRYSMGTVTIRTADGSLAAIDWERTAASFVSPKDKQKQPLFELNHLGGGEFAICYKDNRITTAKSTTVKIPVYLVGNNSAKPNATLSVKVQIA